MIWGVTSEPLPHWSRQKALKMRWTFGNVFATFFLGAVGSRKNLDRYVALCLLYERWEGHVSYDPAWNVHFPHPHPHPLIEYVVYFELPKPSSLHRYIRWLKSYVWTTKVPKTSPHFPPHLKRDISKRNCICQPLIFGWYVRSRGSIEMEWDGDKDIRTEYANI